MIDQVLHQSCMLELITKFCNALKWGCFLHAYSPFVLPAPPRCDALLPTPRPPAAFPYPLSPSQEREKSVWLEGRQATAPPQAALILCGFFLLFQSISGEELEILLSSTCVFIFLLLLSIFISAFCMQK